MQKNWPSDDTPGQQQYIEAEWAPVFLEPIRHSGERITIGIAVVTEDKSVIKVVSTLHPPVLRCLFGNRQHEIVNLSQTILTSLEAHLAGRAKMETWLPPFSGVELGPVRWIQDESIEYMIQKAVNSSSSLGVTEEEQVTPREKTKWFTEIKRAIEHEKPSFSHRFERELLNENKEKIAIIGYVGNRIAANFTEIKPVQNNRNATDQSIRQLVAINSFTKRCDKHLSPDWAGLILHLPVTPLTVAQEKKTRDHLESVRAFSADIGIPVKEFEHTQQAIDFILSDD